MTTSPEPGDTGTRLGREVSLRWRRPGPPPERGRPAQIGSISQSSLRFAHGLGRPVMVRRALAGPAVAAAASARDLNVRPPRWWAQASVFADERDSIDHDVMAPSIARAVRPMPQGTADRPNGLLAATAPRVVPMTLPAEVRAAGRLTDSSDTRSRRAHVPAEKAREPGKPAGTGPVPSDPVRPGGQAPSPAPTVAPAARAGGAPAPPTTGGSTGWLSRLVRRRADVAARSAPATSNPAPTAVAPVRRPPVAADTPGPTASATTGPATADATASTPTGTITPAPGVTTTDAAAPAGAGPTAARTTESTATGTATAVTTDSGTGAGSDGVPTGTATTADAITDAGGDSGSTTTDEPAGPGLTLIVQRWWSGVPHRLRRAAVTGLTGTAALPRGHAGEAAAPPTSAPVVGRARPVAAGLVAVTRSATSAATGASARPSRTGATTAERRSVSQTRSVTGDHMAPGRDAADPIAGPRAASAAADHHPQSPPPTIPGTAADTGRPAGDPADGAVAARPSARPAPMAPFTARRVAQPVAWLPADADRLTRPVVGPGSDRSLPRATSGTAPGPAAAPLVGAAARRRTSPPGLVPAPGDPGRANSVRPAVARLDATPHPPSGPVGPTRGVAASAGPRAGATAPAGHRDVTGTPGSTADRTRADAAANAGATGSASPVGVAPAAGAGTAHGGAVPDSPAPWPRPVAAGASGAANPGATAAPPRSVPVRRRSGGRWRRRDARVWGPAIGLAVTPETAVAGAHRATAGPTVPALAGHRFATPVRQVVAPAVGAGSRVLLVGGHRMAAAPGTGANPPVAGGHRAAASPVAATTWYAPGPPGPAGTATMPVAPPRTVVRSDPIPGDGARALAPPAPPTPERRPGAAAGAASRELPARIAALADSAWSTAAAEGASPDPFPPGGAVTPPTSAPPHPEPDAAAAGESDDVISAVVRRVLDAELRDRVNAVVDERLDAERDRRRWRSEAGPF